MSVQVEKLEKNMAKLTIEVDAAQFEDAMKKAFNKNKNKFNIPGFRKGKAPRAMIEKMYGEGIFYEDAADEAINATCMQAMDESGLEIVSRPEVAVEQIGKDKPFIYTALVAVRPEVILGEYKGIEVEKADASVTAEDVEAELKKVQEQNARLLNVEDRPVADGDKTVIDFEGFKDDVPFEGGKGESYPLVIGSGSFIPGFEEQLVGMKANETKDINVTFPAEYQAAELAGQPVVFKVTVHEIKKKELPALDDELVKQAEIKDVETLEAYKEYLKKQLTEAKTNQAEEKYTNDILTKICENSKVEIPQIMIDDETDRLVNDFAQRLQSQGFSLDQFKQITGQSQEAIRAELGKDAEQKVNVRLVLEAIAAKEGIEVSDEEVEAEYTKLAENYHMEVEKIKELLDHNAIAYDLEIRKAMDLVKA